MKVSVFGLGYVGCVSIACLSRLRHQVIGVDIMKSKVDAISAGIPTVVEPEVDNLIAQGHRDGTIRATQDGRQAVLDSDSSLICVGTPSSPSGEHDLSAVFATADAIGQALLQNPMAIWLWSAAQFAPGTIETQILPRIIREDNKYADRISVVIIPEFLRECTASEGLYNPPLVVVGTIDGKPAFHQGAIAALMATDPERIQWVQYRQAENVEVVVQRFSCLESGICQRSWCSLPRDRCRWTDGDESINARPKAQHFSRLPPARTSLWWIVPTQRLKRDGSFVATLLCGLTPFALHLRQQ